VKKLGILLTILFIVGTVLIFSSKSNAASNPNCPQGNIFKLCCRSGSNMALEYLSAGATAIRGATKAAQGASAQFPGGGQCAWMDRPLNQYESPGNITIFGMESNAIENIVMNNGKVEIARVKGTNFTYLYNKFKSSPDNGGIFYLFCCKDPLGLSCTVNP